MNNDPDFVQNFVQALGNIYKFSSRKAEFVYADQTEALLTDQELEDIELAKARVADAFRNRENRLLQETELAEVAGEPGAEDPLE